MYKIQIRRGAFETNSSSTHSITMCTKNEYDEWRAGKLYRNDGWWGSSSFSSLKDNLFLTRDEAIALVKSSTYYRPMDDDEDIDEYLREYEIYSYENWGRDYEYDVNYYTTPGGEEIVAVCYYGYN